MKLIVAIDAYNLSTGPYTSLAIYIDELTRSFSKNPDIIKIYLLIPSIPDNNFKYHSLANDNKIKFIYPESSFNPTKDWLHTVTWVQSKVLKCLKGIPNVNLLISPYHQVPLRLPKRITSVVVIHDICGLDTKLYPILKKGLYKHYFNFITSLLRANIFVPISKFTKDQFLGKFPSTKKRMSKVVYNNISSALIGDEIMKNTFRKYNLKEGSYFLVIGEMSSRKGIDLIVESWKIYQSKAGNSTLFMVVGKHQLEYIKEYLAENNIRNFNVITGVTPEERDSLYRGAIALLFPSRCEGFGFPILEAMVQGCPPIAWKKSPAIEIVGEEEFLLKTLEPKEIAEFLSKYDDLTEKDRLELADRLKILSSRFMKDDFGVKFYEAISELK